MFVLSPETKKNISACVGMSYEELRNWDYESEQPNNQKVIFSKNIDKRKPVRGNPLLAKGRFRTMKDVDEKLRKILNNG